MDGESLVATVESVLPELMDPMPEIVVTSLVEDWLKTQPDGVYDDLFHPLTTLLERYGKTLGSPFSIRLDDRLFALLAPHSRWPRHWFYYGFYESDGQLVAVILHGTEADSRTERERAADELEVYRDDPRSYEDDEG